MLYCNSSNNILNSCTFNFQKL